MLLATTTARWQDKPGKPIDERKKVEERKSSEAELAKGEINFDDLKFEIDKDAPFTDSLLIDDVKKLVGKKVKLAATSCPAHCSKRKTSTNSYWSATTKNVVSVPVRLYSIA